MTSQSVIIFISNALDAYYSSHSFGTVAKDPPFEPQSGGAPPEMWNSQPDTDGWVEWKMLPSTVSERDLEQLEAEFEVKLPAILASYFRARFHLFDQVAIGDLVLILPSVPSDSPFRPIRANFLAWRQLMAACFLPFGSFQDGWGPLCFDLKEGSADDAPICWFDHEHLAPLSKAELGDRATLEPLKQPLFGSFRELLSRLRSTV
ncbi:MAG: SMI1/KNR4 family protein [Acidobacteria bacterium]|nr:SMI1/KNR4 family protein [Acidobacteriota bacterium]MCB9399054.1 SMI1/KNR4 family protein [Acidobacteriota bacterium]